MFASQRKRLVAAVSLSLLVLQPMGATAATGDFSYYKAIPGLIVTGGPVLQGSASLSNTSLTFAAQEVGTTSTAQNVTVTNNGTAPLTIFGVSVDQGITHFNQSNDCAVPIAVGMSCAISVAMTPRDSGALFGRVLVGNDGSSGAGVIELTGAGEQRLVEIRSNSTHLPLATIYFENTKLTETSAAITVEVANTGASPVTFAAQPVSVVAPFKMNGTTCPSGGVLAPSAVCTVSLAFSPVTAQHYNVTGGLTVHSNAASGSAATLAAGVLPVIGTLVVPTATVGETAFGLTTPASSSTGAFTYTSSNPAVVTINNNSLTASGVGTSVITATQAADANYASASTTAIAVVEAKIANFATWNPLDKAASCTLTNGNLDAACTTWTGVRATAGKSTGKWYWEVTISDGTVKGFMLGISTATPAVASGVLFQESSALYYPDASSPPGGIYLAWTGATSTSFITAPETGTAGTTYMIALDMDNNTMYIGKNGGWLSNANPAMGVKPWVSGISGVVFPVIVGLTQTTTNFGATAFKYAVPAGFNPGLFN